MPPHPDRDYARTIRAWCFYDWASSAFATTIMVALFPPFFRSLAMRAGHSSQDATAYWGYATALALLLMALAAPLLGAITDHVGRPKRSLAFFAGIGICATAGFVFIGPQAWLLAAGLFIVGDLGFSGANVIYESILPRIAKPRDIDRVSARGYALGYVGSGILLALNLAWITKPHLFGLDSPAAAVRASFLSVAVWWAVFSIPLLRRDIDPTRGRPPLREHVSAVRSGVARIAATFRELPRYRPLLGFLIAYWIYSDGIGTIVKMATAFGDEIGIGLTDMLAALVITQSVGIPCSLLFGRLAGKIGAKRAILLGLAVYALISIGGFFMRTATHFYLLASLVGVVQGGTQALSRSLFACMVPRHKSAEFFGFFASSGRFAGILGPALFALLTQLTGSSRGGILAVAGFFIAGGLLLARVDVAGGRACAQEDPAYAGE